MFKHQSIVEEVAPQPTVASFNVVDVGNVAALFEAQHKSFSDVNACISCSGCSTSCSGYSGCVGCSHTYRASSENDAALGSMEALALAVSA
jgi:hypothetical protein